MKTLSTRFKNRTRTSFLSSVLIKFLLGLLILGNISGSLFGQCNPYYVLSKTTEYEMEHFNAKDKKTGKSIYKVKEFSPSANGYNAVIDVATYDDKDKLQGEAREMEVKCDKGTVSIDLKSYIPAESMKAYENMKLSFSGENMELPAKLNTGESLKDGVLRIDITNNNNDKFANVDIKISNRKVESKESVTTPAGTFDCYKITYDMDIATEMMGIKIPSSIKGAEWFAEKVGMVKTQSFNKSGKLVGYTQLKSYK